MSDAHGVARDQLRAFVERIERLEEEKKTIADDIKDVYGEAKSMGFDTKILKKVIALRKKDEQERTEEEMILDTYLQALGMIPQFEMFDREEVRPASREQRRRQIMSEDMADHKALLDEMADAGLISEVAREENKALADAVATKFGNGPAKPLQSPRKAAEAVSERTAPFQAKTSDDACEAGRKALGRAEASAEAPDGAELVSRVVDGRTSTATSERMDATAGETAPHSESAPASQGEAEAPSVERVRPQADEATTGSADANTGGDDEVAPKPDHAATAGVLVTHQAPATYILRPNCLRPERCAGHGTNHCHACKVAARESEAA